MPKRSDRMSAASRVQEALALRNAKAKLADVNVDFNTGFEAVEPLGRFHTAKTARFLHDIVQGKPFHAHTDAVTRSVVTNRAFELLAHNEHLSALPYLFDAKKTSGHALSIGQLQLVRKRLDREFNTNRPRTKRMLRQILHQALNAGDWRDAAEHVARFMSDRYSTDEIANEIHALEKPRRSGRFGFHHALELLMGSHEFRLEHAHKLAHLAFAQSPAAQGLLQILKDAQHDPALRNHPETRVLAHAKTVLEYLEHRGTAIHNEPQAYFQLLPLDPAIRSHLQDEKTRDRLEQLAYDVHWFWRRDNVDEPTPGVFPTLTAQNLHARLDVHDELKPLLKRALFTPQGLLKTEPALFARAYCAGLNPKTRASWKKNPHGLTLFVRQAQAQNARGALKN